jgi:hypothetical protein
MERLGFLAPHQTATERPRSADVLAGVAKILQLDLVRNLLRAIALS